MFKLLFGAVLVAAAGAVVVNLPDIKRYLQIRSM
jgi:hypothetical protein